MSFLSLFLLYLPAFAANATPVVVRNLPFLKGWNTPISRSLLGINKTYRGLLCGLVIALLVGLFLHTTRQWLPSFGDGDAAALYSSKAAGALTGLLLGLGALGGDIVKSFFKRRIGIQPGDPLPLFDGIDYILGALLALSPLYVPSLWGIGFLILLSPILSIVSNMCSYCIGWKEQWY